MLYELYVVICNLQTKNPDGFFIVTKDFNHANQKSVVPILYQHIDFTTCGTKIQDLVYTSIHGAYKFHPVPISAVQTAYLLGYIQTTSEMFHTSSETGDNLV